jgi:hypothetical protein
VAGEQLGAGPTTVTLSVTGAAGAVSVTGIGGAASCGTVRPASDHLRLAYADAGAVVYRPRSSRPWPRACPATRSCSAVRRGRPAGRARRYR